MELKNEKFSAGFSDLRANLGFLKWKSKKSERDGLLQKAHALREASPRTGYK